MTEPQVDRGAAPGPLSRVRGPEDAPARRDPAEPVELERPDAEQTATGQSIEPKPSDSDIQEGQERLSQPAEAWLPDHLRDRPPGTSRRVEE